MNTINETDALSSRGAQGEDPSPAGIGFARMLYKQTPFYEWGDDRYMRLVSEMPIVENKVYHRTPGWKTIVEIREKERQRLVLVKRRPTEAGNIYEELEVWEGGKPLPPEAFE
jgi:hypothetical protein